VCNITVMKLFLPLLILTGFLFGQDLYFKNDNNETIKIEIGEKLQINNNKYTLISTDYSKQYLLVKKYNSQIQDTLSFDSVVSFKYYEKSLRSFASSVFKGFISIALIGGVLSYPYDGDWGSFFLGGGTRTQLKIGNGLYFGTFLGVPCGALYGILIPRVSDEIILEKEGWYISK